MDKKEKIWNWAMAGFWFFVMLGVVFYMNWKNQNEGNGADSVPTPVPTIEATAVP